MTALPARARAGLAPPCSPRFAPPPSPLRRADAPAGGVPAAIWGDIMSAAAFARTRPAAPVREALLRGPRARADAEWVAGIEPTWRCTDPEIQEAADEAARRCAQALLAQRLDQVQAEVPPPTRTRSGVWTERTRSSTRPGRWKARPSAALVRPVAAREAVSAA